MNAALRAMERSLPRVSVIVAAHNAASTIGNAIRSAAAQTYAGPIEIVVYDDGSTDDTAAAARAALPAGLSQRSVLVVTPSDVGAGVAHGPGFARNRAVEASSGEYICLLDADDECMADRVEAQLHAAEVAAAASVDGRHALVGGGFTRVPSDATPAYTLWANGISDAELYTERFREVTILQPTWFMHRTVWDNVGGYDEVLPISIAEPAQGRTCTAAATSSDESVRFLGCKPRRLALADIHSTTTSPGPTSCVEVEAARRDARPAVVPEDPIFFHRWLASGGALARVRSPVISYTFGSGSQTWRTPRDLLLRVKAALFEDAVLNGRGGGKGPGTLHWPGKFMIWGAGRDGKAFFNALSPTAQSRVSAFAEVDPRKIGQVYPQPVATRFSQQCCCRSVASSRGGEAHSSSPIAHSTGEHTEEGGAIDNAASPIDCSNAPGASRLTATTRKDKKSKKRDRQQLGSTVDTADDPPGCTRCEGRALAPIPIRHFSECSVGPIACCVALTTGGDELRANVASLRLTPGVDFLYMC